MLPRAETAIGKAVLFFRFFRMVTAAHRDDLFEGAEEVKMPNIESGLEGSGDSVGSHRYINKGISPFF